MPEEQEVRLLRQLIGGSGITESSYEALLKQRQVCGNYFKASVLKKHVPVCKDTVIVFE
jgi:hypothetical protein